MKKIIFILSCGLLLFSSCKDSEEEKEASYKSENCLNLYIIPDSSETIISDIDTTNGSIEVIVSINGKYASRDYKRVSKQDSSISEDNNIALFDSLSNRYNDHNFNSYVPMEGNRVLAYPVSKISITSDSDYDESHPAGTELLDIVSATLNSFGNSYLNNSKPTNEICITKQVSDLTEGDLMLISKGIMYFVFPNPTSAKSHNIHMKIGFDNGEMQEFYVNLKFE